MYIIKCKYEEYKKSSNSKINFNRFKCEIIFASNYELGTVLYEISKLNKEIKENNQIIESITYKLESINEYSSNSNRDVMEKLGCIWIGDLL